MLTREESKQIVSFVLSELKKRGYAYLTDSKLDFGKSSVGKISGGTMRPMDVEYQSYQTDIVITSVDHNTISWGSANIKFADGRAKTISPSAGTDLTGTADVTYNYIYYVFDDPVLKVTTDYSATIGKNIVLLASAIPTTTGAFAMIIPYGSRVPTLNAVAISANSINATHIQAGTITADRLSFTAALQDDLDDVAGDVTQLETDISAGNITVSSSTTLSGTWTPLTGVSISATSGINIWGKDNALTTRATETGTVQCYVGADGAIYAGAGAVKLDQYGLNLKGQYVNFQADDGTNKGYITGVFEIGSNSYLGISSQYDHLYLDAGAGKNVRVGGSVYVNETTGEMSLTNHKITNLADPVDPQDAATKGYVDGISGYDPSSSASVIPSSTTNELGSVSNYWGKLYIGQPYNYISGSSDDMDFWVKTSTNSSVLAMFIESADNPTINMSSHKVVNMATPTADADAATKQYVDTIHCNNLPVDVKSSRTTGGIYQNTTGKALFVKIIVRIQRDVDLMSWISCYMSWNSDMSSSVKADYYQWEYDGSELSSTIDVTTSVSFIVPNGAYYEVNFGSSTTGFTIVNWLEQS